MTELAGYGRGMDLIAWIRSDLDALEARFQGGIVRQVPPARWGEQIDGGGSTLHHLLLHLTRHHDLAVRTVIGGHPPRFLDHRTPLGLAHLPPTVGIAEAEDRGATGDVDHDALLAFAAATVDHTRAWLDHVGSLALDTVPPASHRLATLAEIPDDHYGWLHEMWAGKTVAWLLQWPVIGHGNAHVGEMVSIRNRMGLSPF